MAESITTSPDLNKLFEELPGRIAEAVQSVAGVPVLLIDIVGVCQATSLSRATVYRMISAGEFPSPVKCPSARWRMRDVSEWVNRLKTR